MAIDSTGQYNLGVPFIPSDTVNFPRGLSDAIYVGGAGILVVVFENDQTTFFTCVAGSILPLKAKRINAASTTATLINILYRV